MLESTLLLGVCGACLLNRGEVRVPLPGVEGVKPLDFFGVVWPCCSLPDVALLVTETFSLLLLAEVASIGVPLTAVEVSSLDGTGVTPGNA